MWQTLSIPWQVAVSEAWAAEHRIILATGAQIRPIHTLVGQ
jgi:hypothetical protein